MSAGTVTRRGDSKPTPDLARLIDLVNEERELPDIRELFYKEDSGHERGRSRTQRDVWIEICSKIAESLKPSTREFLGEPSNLEKFIDRYGALRSAQQTLPVIAQQRDGEEQCDYDLSGFTSVAFPVDVNFFLQNGVIAASGTLTNTLVGVRADRIRRCAVCGNFFWARRINSACCSERCRKTYNQRNSRSARRAMSRKRSAKKGR